MAALALATLHSGARYFYCDALGLMAFDPCAQAAREEPTGPLEALRTTPVDCCQQLTMPTMPEGTAVREPTVHPASWSCVVPPAHQDTAPLLLASPQALRESARWRGPPKWGDHVCIRWMVSLS